MKESSPIKVLLVDDHPVFREGIVAVLQGEEEFLLVGEAANGEEATEFFRSVRPDVTLMDLQMHGLSGIETIRLIRREFPDARFVVLTTYSKDAQVLRALEAGAAGYLLKSALRKELLNTIRAVHAGGKSICPEVATEVAKHILDDVLSEREIQVLKRVAGGTANRVIGSELGLTEATVKSHLKSIMLKLGANDRTHAVVIGIKRGILDG
jgi:DNA-binding NarL/FixJ family response regulator